MTDYELYHSGRKGMKWGQHIFGKIKTGARKVANYDVGKPMGKAAKATGKLASKVGKKTTGAVNAKVKQTVSEHKEKAYYKKLYKKKLSQMTDKEIKDLTERVKKEASLKDAKYESRAQNARKFYNTVAKQPVNTFFSTYSKAAIESAFKTNNNNDNK